MCIELMQLTRADRFNVPLSFLSQQAAWLYERQLSQVRAQLRKANKSTLVEPFTMPGSIVGNSVVNERPMGRRSSQGNAISHDPCTVN